MLQRRISWLAVCLFGLGGLYFFYGPMRAARGDDETLFNLPGDRPQARPRPRPMLQVKFNRVVLPPIYRPPKEWRSFRSTSRINVAVRQGHTLWAGTQGSGLIHWDMRTGAYRFYLPQRKTLSARTVLSLAAGRGGDLWIGTNGDGLALLKHGRSKWQFFTRKHGLPGLTIHAVLVAKNGDVWVGTTRGAARYRRGRWKKYTVQNGLPSNDIRALAQDHRGRIWFSPNIASPFYLRGRRFVRTKGFPVVGVTCMVPDRRGGLWMCSDQGALYYRGHGKPKLYTVSHGLAGPFVQTIYVDASGGVWFGTRRSGMSYFRNGQWVTMARAHGLPGLDIRGIVGGPRGQLFAVTFLNGALRYQGGRWHRLPFGIVGNRINAITCGPDGAVWVGTASGASRYFKRYWFNYTSNLPSVDVRAFAFEPSGAVWMGTYGGGVVRFDGKQLKTVDTTDGLGSNKIIGAGLTPEGLWFLHPLKGLSLYNGKSWKTFTSQSHGAVLQASHPFSTLHIDPKFQLWIGTQGSGPVVHPLDGGWRRFSRMTGASNRGIIFSIAVAQDGTRWFGTRHGLYRYRKGKLKRFTTRDGLPHNRVQAVALEGAKIWIGTPKGVAVFDGTSWRSFTQDMGLVSNDITVITVTPWGDKWFGSRYDGLTIYRGE